LTDGEGSDGVDEGADAEPVPLNNDRTSIFGFGFAEDADPGVEGGGVEAADDDEEPTEIAGGLADTGDFPFIVFGVVAGTEPNDLTPSAFIAGTETGDEDICAPASSIEPKVTAEPLLAAPTLLLLMLTPSLIGIPWPRVLGRRE
jgi:hypothetical protein